MAIFTILILPIHEHGTSFQLLRSSLISFFRDLRFFSYRSFICSFRVTPRYYIYVKGVVSLISCSACLSFEYRKATDLLELILYLATLLKLFTSYRNSLMEFLGSLKYSIISSSSSDIFTLISNLYPFDLLLLSNCSS